MYNEAKDVQTIPHRQWPVLNPRPLTGLNFTTEGHIDSAGTESQAAVDSNAENLQSFAANQLGRAYQLVANPAAEGVYVYIGRHEGKHIGPAFSDVVK